MKRIKQQATEGKQNRSETGIDTGLIAMFLEMTPEECLRFNDNAVHTITVDEKCLQTKINPELQI
jgi:hypothetical protein